MKEGDYLVGIGDQDVKWSSHAEVVKQIKMARNTLKIKLVTPLDKAVSKKVSKDSDQVVNSRGNLTLNSFLI